MAPETQCIFNAHQKELGEEWDFMLTADVLHGYRIRLSWQQIFLSLFKWHNETMNVWTHLAGATVFLWIFWHVAFGAEPAFLGLERWPVCLFLATAVLCMGF